MCIRDSCATVDCAPGYQCKIDEQTGVASCIHVENDNDNDHDGDEDKEKVESRFSVKSVIFPAFGILTSIAIILWVIIGVIITVKMKQKYQSKSPPKRQQEQGEQKPLAGSPQDPTNMQELKNSQLE